MKRIFCLILTVFICIPMCSCGNNKNSPSNQTILYNLSDDPDTLDPQVANSTSSQIVLTNIFEGLVKVDKDNNLVPGVASSWEHNSDYTSFTFHLRENAVWSDKNKTPVTADDFIFGIRRAVAKETDAPNASLLFPIKNAREIHNGNLSDSTLGISAPDSKTIVINLEYSYDDFPRILSYPVAMPCNEAFFESTNGKYGLESSTTLCNGPFKLQSKYGWSHDEDIYLIANDSYIGNFSPIPAGITFSIGEDTSDLVNCIETNQVDAGPLLSSQLEIAKQKNFSITTFENTTCGLCFNFQDEVFSNLNIRKAFITAIDRDYALSSIPENCTVASDIIMDSAIIDGKNYRELAGSNLYLKESDNPSSYLNAGLKELGLTELPVVTIICEDDPRVKSIVNNMIEVFNKKLSYYFNINAMSEDKVNSKVQLGQYQIIITSISSSSDNPIEVLSAFRTNASNNPCDMKDSTYDKLLESCENARTNEKIDLCSQAEKYLNNVGAFYPLYYKNRYFACAANVSGIAFYHHNSGIDFSKAVKTKR